MKICRAFSLKMSNLGGISRDFSFDNMLFIINIINIVIIIIIIIIYHNTYI